MNEKAGSIFEYLKLRQDFENAFPGYESEIHGVERTENPLAHAGGSCGHNQQERNICLKRHNIR